MAIGNRRTNVYDPGVHKVGLQPVRVLQQELMKAFSYLYLQIPPADRSKLLDVVPQYGIGYDPSEEAVVFPHIEPDRQIVFQETYLSYLWTVCHMMTVLLQEGIQKVVDATTGLVEVEKVNKGRVQIAIDLAAFGHSLLRTYTPWDKDKFPNPELYESNEKTFVNQVNAVFIYATEFVFGHEFAHAVNCDVDFPAPDQESKRREAEADKYGVEFVIDNIPDGHGFSARVGIACGLCSLLLPSAKAQSSRHPDTDKRLQMALEVMRVPDEEDLVWAVGCFGLQIWDLVHGRFEAWKDDGQGTYKELFYKLLARERNP